ncbi:MAG: flagellar hook-associated protein FlgL [Nevskia sp.]|nr:flagellar hook-associated protein FlgL [Nevskia sp.]
MIRVANSTYYQQAVAGIDQNQTQLATVQQQMGNGLRIQTASDDPIAAGQVLGVNQTLSDISQWQANATSLQASLGLENNALTSVNTSLQQIQTLALEANNATLGASDRQALAQQMQQQLNSIVQQANTQDSNGDYIFAGTASHNAPFSQTATGATYNGNSNVNMLTLGPTSEVAAGDAGDAAFMQLKSGDGSIAASAAAANTGTASLSDASVTNPAQYNGGTYTVQFNGGNYQVLDSGNNVVSSGAYTDGSAIQFNGLSMTFTGTPGNGDSFTVGPSTTQSLFGGVQNLINLVANPGSTAAQRAQNQTAIYGALQSLTGAQNHITDVLAGVGARQQAATNATTQLQSRTTQLQSTLSGLQDLDYAQATTQFSRAQTTLQAAEQSYVQIQGLSLFNYIK